MITSALTDLWYGFGVALEPHNLLWCFVGVLIGNMVGVLPGMGPLATISTAWWRCAALFSVSAACRSC